MNKVICNILNFTVTKYQRVCYFWFNMESNPTCKIVIENMIELISMLF